MLRVADFSIFNTIGGHISIQTPDQIDLIQFSYQMAF
jgi:hypothetical protein